MSDVNTNSLVFNGLGLGKDTEISNLNYAKPVFEFNKYSIGAEDIITEAEQLIKQSNEAKESIKLFTVKTANSWIEQAKKRPIPKMLFSGLWYQGEICNFFAYTNLGKTNSGLQIADNLSTGNQIPHFCPQGKKLYFNRTELDQWLQRNRQSSIDEIETMAANYLLTNKRK